MIPSRPYLLRAFYEWIIDNDWTPYVVVELISDDIEVPLQYVEDGRIILNISPQAVKNLNLTNQSIDFDARFSGIPHQIYAPIQAVSAVYAKENGRGMIFRDEEDFPPTDEPPAGDEDDSGINEGEGEGEGKRKAGHLTLVKK